MLGDNLLTAVAVAGSSGMVDSHHRVIVIKASSKTVGVAMGGHCPALSYHVLGSDGVSPELLCASTSSVKRIESDNNHFSELLYAPLCVYFQPCIN